MRIGGFVIHGNNAGTLGRCLDSLLAVSDEVVAIDSCSTDGSADIVRSKGVRHEVVPWQGYGFARAAAVERLAGCDWIFFLDSDEWLAPQAQAAIRAWREEEPAHDRYLLVRRDRVELPDRRYCFRTERHVRLMRREVAAWRPEMIVHEAIDRAGAGFIDAPIEHAFVSSVDDLLFKHDRYALLWAIRAHAEGRKPKNTLLQRPAHVVRDCLVKGAFFRGGMNAVRLGWAVSRYHQRKHELLREVRAGGHAEAVRAFEEKRWTDLFA